MLTNLLPPSIEFEVYEDDKEYLVIRRNFKNKKKMIKNMKLIEIINASSQRYAEKIFDNKYFGIKL